MPWSVGLGIPHEVAGLSWANRRWVLKHTHAADASKYTSVPRAFLPRNLAQRDPSTLPNLLTTAGLRGPRALMQPQVGRRTEQKRFFLPLILFRVSSRRYRRTEAHQNKARKAGQESRRSCWARPGLPTWCWRPNEKPPRRWWGRFSRANPRLIFNGAALAEAECAFLHA